TNVSWTLIIRPRWKNSGSTPPKNMIVNVNWILQSGDLPESFSYRYDNIGTMKMFVGPGATEWSAPIVIPPPHAMEITQGPLSFYIWGRVDYEDVFDATSPHFTEW